MTRTLGGENLTEPTSKSMAAACLVIRHGVNVSKLTTDMMNECYREVKASLGNILHV